MGLSPHLLGKLLLVVETVCLGRDGCWRFGDTLPEPAAEISPGGNGGLVGRHQHGLGGHESKGRCRCASAGERKGVACSTQSRKLVVINDRTSCKELKDAQALTPARGKKEKNEKVKK